MPSQPPPSLEDVHEAVLRHLPPGYHFRVLLQYPGFIDVHVSLRLTMGFDDQDGYSAILKDRATDDEEVVGLLPSPLTPHELLNAEVIAKHIIHTTGLPYVDYSHR